MHHLVIGLGKSGTTILFTRIRGSLPPETRTFFEPSTTEQLKAVLSNSTPTLTKCLLNQISADELAAREFDRNVLIVRDPRDRLISDLLYKFYEFSIRQNTAGFEEARHLLAKKVQEPRCFSTIGLFERIKELGEVTPPGFDVQHARVVDYQRLIDPYCLRYEDFVDGATQGLEDYLGIQLSAGVEVDDRFRRVTRSRSYGEWRSWLTDEDVEYVNSTAGEFMKLFGYEPEPPELRHKISVTTSLGYVEQFRPPSRGLRSRLHSMASRLGRLLNPGAT
jgi:Protein of unknown function (DUF3102)